MTDEEVIKQLKSLREHCASMIKDEDILTKDLDALNSAIDLFRFRQDGLLRKKGFWIEAYTYYDVDEITVNEIICSNCGYRKEANKTPNYCENCGAEIVGYPMNKYAEKQYVEIKTPVNPPENKEALEKLREILFKRKRGMSNE